VALPTLLANFRQHHPGVSIELVTLGSVELGRQFQQERFDVIIADPARLTMMSALHWSRQLVWSASRILTIDEDEPLPLILFEGSCSWQDQMLTALADAGRPWRTGCKVSTFAALLAALRAALGVALLLPENLPSDCESVEAKLALPSAPRANFGLFIADTPSGLGQEFGAFLQRAFAL
jgi:DNA-binding transcriptional LysR family regulator